MHLKQFLRFWCFFMFLPAFAQSTDSLGKYPLVSLEAGTYYQTPAWGFHRFQQGWTIYGRVAGDVLEIVKTQFVFYGFRFRLYKGLFFSFRQGFTYDYIHYGFSEYHEPETYINEPGYLYKKPYKGPIYSLNYALGYRFRIRRMPVAVYYHFNKSITVEDHLTLLFPSKSFGWSYYYKFSMEGPGVEVAYKRLRFGVSINYNGGNMGATGEMDNNFGVWIFSLSYRIKDWY